MSVDYDKFCNFGYCRKSLHQDCDECLLKFLCYTSSQTDGHRIAEQIWNETGGKISTIKAYREITGVGLKEAKEYVEGVIMPTNPIGMQLYREQGMQRR